VAHIQYLTQIHLDAGVVHRLGDECQRAGIRRRLVISDTYVRAAGVLDRAVAAIGKMPYAVFDATPSNPTEDAVRAAAAVHERRHWDGLIAVGGGSSIDLTPSAPRLPRRMMARWPHMPPSKAAARRATDATSMRAGRC
jgi:alcohol dehydrogenase class IV